MPLVLPLLVAWAATAVLLFLDGRRGRAALAAAAALAVVVAATGWLLAGALGGVPRDVVTGGWPYGVGIRLRGDALGLLFALVSQVSVLAALLHEVAQGIVRRSFPALCLMLATGLTGIFLTGDVFNFYVFFEMSMVAAFGLASYGTANREFRAAGVFIVVNLVGSMLFLVSVAALYRLTGTLDMHAVAVALGGLDVTAGHLAATTMFIAFGLKLGLFPFHFWVPAVYRRTRPTVSALLGGALVNLGAYGLVRFGGEVFPAVVEAGAPVLVAFGATSVLYGGLLAVSRRSGTEVLAYSAIGQVGYVLVALGVGGAAGWTAAVLWAVINSLHKTLLFLAVGLRGRLAGAAFAVGGFSLAGLPPAVGFPGKLALLRMGVGEPWVVALLVGGATLSLVYIFRTYQHRWWAGDRGAASSGWRCCAPAACLAALVVALGLWPEPLVAAGVAAAGVLAEGRP